MTVSTCRRPALPPAAPRSMFTWRHVGAGQIADGDGVGAAECVEVDVLDAVEVHGDVGRRRG